MSAGKDAHLAADIRHPLASAVAEHDERRVVERKAERAQADRRVARRAEVLDDDDVGWILLHVVAAARHDAHTHARFVVQTLPLGLDRLGRRRACEQDSHVVAAARECKRDERGRRSDPVAGVPEQLVGDEHNARLARMATARRVVVIAHELRGFRPGGGMGTATTLLAMALARLGHSVEILLGKRDPRTLDPHWAEAYRDAGISIRPVPRMDEPVEPWEFAHAHGVMLGLRDDPPDVVVAHDFGAPAYSSLRVRHAGLGFEDTLFVLFCHGPRRYVLDLSGDPDKKLDRRLAIALAIGLDTLQNR